MVGEVAAEAFYKDLENKILTGKIEPKDIQSWVNLGVDLSKLAAGFAAAAAGGDVNTAAQTGGNAARNNAGTIAIGLAGLVGSAAFLAIMSKADWKKAIESAGSSIEKLNEGIREKIQEYQQQQATNNPGGRDGTPLNPPDIKTGTELIPPKVDAPTTEVYPGNSGMVPQLPGGASVSPSPEDFILPTPGVEQKTAIDYIVYSGQNVPPPPGKQLSGYPDAEYIGNINGRATWKNGKERLQWDSETGSVERYSQTGKHIGEFSTEGKQLKGPNPRYKYKGK